MSARVLVVMGSDSDFDVMEGCARVLRDFEVPFEVRVSSAHRTPDATHRLAREAAENGVGVIIAGAGSAAHLAGVIAASSRLPVIGVPIDSSALHGVDALYSTVQMPGGVPVGTMGIGRSGAKNAGLLAVRILALADAGLQRKLADYHAKMTDEVAAKDARLQTEVKKRLGGA